MIWRLFRRPAGRDATPPEIPHRDGIQIPPTASPEDAERLLLAAIRAAPDAPVPQVQLGVVLARAGRLDEAVPYFERGVALDPCNPYAQTNLANAHRQRGHLDAALEHYRAAVALSPDLPLAWSNMLRPLMDAGDWTGVETGLAALLDLRARGDGDWPRYIAPWDSLLLPLSAAERREIAEYHAARLPAVAGAAPRALPAPQSRLRIGYLSRDFRDHAVGQLACALFRFHDRTRFEIVAYSYGRDDGSAYRRAAEAGAERFVDVAALSVEDTAHRIAGDAVDILVDLGGYTKEHRLGALARRPAPVQAHYLGYPATLGARFIDYYLTDHVASPAGQDEQFMEALVRLPGCFMVSDPDQPIAGDAPSRASFGLAEHAVVLCAFHQTAKIHPAVMTAWLAILAAVPDAVLWLRAPAVEAQRRWAATAAAAGVDPARLVFAPTVAEKRAHIERIAAADLFLDTFDRYGGHSTVNEALWAALPVLTVAGESFASRVGASLLAAAGVPDLALDSVPAYVNTAIRLCRDAPARHARRERLLAARGGASLFDGAATVRHIEAAYEAMWARHTAGLPAAAMDIPWCGQSQIR